MKKEIFKGIAKELKYDLLEINSSDLRNEEQIRTFLDAALGQRSLFFTPKLILIDEVDNISGVHDRGCIPALLKAMEKMKNIQQKVEANPEKFAELAKKYSEDTTASKGGFIDYFKRGTYDADIEKEAFKLKEKNQISSVISTKEGLVIIQLVDRKAAKDKPFSSVRDEIVKSLRQKKAVNQVRSDLETILHLVKDQSGAIDTFVKEKGFKTEKTGFLERNEAGYELIATLSRKIFDKKNVSENFGFFEFEIDNILLCTPFIHNISFVPLCQQVFLPY